MKVLLKYIRAVFRLKYYLPLAILFTGCATQMPVSEGLVFTDQETNQTKDSFWAENLSTEMMVETSTFIAIENFRRAAVKKFGSNETDYELNEAFLYTLSLPSFSVGYRNRAALGSTIPLLSFWQVDGTVRIFEDYYLTLNKKVFFKNTEVILQRKLFYRNDGGISLGTFYRYDPFQLINQSDGSREPFFYTSWFGIRSVFQTPEPIGTGFHARGFMNGGYAPVLKAPLITVGISLIFSPR